MYTMDLRTIIEQASQYTHGLTISERIEIGRIKLFNFSYPIFDETYKKVFETNFIRNFYMREIGYETEGLFKFYLETWLNVNMPYFNKLFESELLDYDPFVSYELTTEHNRVNEKLENTTKDTEMNEDRNKEQTSSNIATNTKSLNESQSIDNEKTIDSLITANQNKSSTLTNSSNQTTDGETSGTNNSFKRNIESNNPDTRLAITPNEDGSGVIEYASRINEDKLNNVETLTNDVIVNTTEDSNINDELVETNDNLTTETSSSTMEIISTNIEDSSNSVEASETDKNITSLSDTSALTGNEVEDYRETRRGTIGVKTIQQMLIEYRETFLRIENDIFKEMNQLFMLVY